MLRKKKFRPDWTETAPEAGTIRSIVKYGSPCAFKHPSDGWVSMMMEEFGMTAADFSRKQDEGRQKAVLDRPVSLDARHVERLKDIAGEHNVVTDDYSRIRYAYGKTTEELMELRTGIIKEAADVVVHPRDKADVARIVAYCNEHVIPVTVFAAGSSVNFGVRPARGGVTLALGTHMNKLLEINEANQTARVQPGMFGPAYEEAPVSYTHLRAHETPEHLVCRLLLEKKKTNAHT